MKTLDAIDQRLLALLQDNARTPMVALAKSVGLSRSATQERLQRLEGSGTIEKYTVRLGAVGPMNIQAWLFLRFAAGFSCEDVLPILTRMPEVKLCHSVAGETDLLVLVEAETPSALAQLRERAIAFKGVDDVRTMPVLAVKLDRR